MRCPRRIGAGGVSADMVLNVDFAPTFLELAGLQPDEGIQGRSFAPILAGDTPSDWRQSFYYRYWMHRSHHNVFAHYGVRTHRHKLIYYYADGLGHSGSVGERHDPEWELFDLQEDPAELHNIVDRPDMADTVAELKDELHRLQAEVGDQRYQLDVD